MEKNSTIIKKKLTVVFYGMQPVPWLFGGIFCIHIVISIMTLSRSRKPQGILFSYFCWCLGKAVISGFVNALILLVESVVVVILIRVYNFLSFRTFTSPCNKCHCMTVAEGVASCAPMCGRRRLVRKVVSARFGIFDTAAFPSRTFPVRSWFIRFYLLCLSTLFPCMWRSCIRVKTQK